MTVVVTGATGHLGANLVRALIAQGRPTRCLVHVSTAALEGLDTGLVRGDICDAGSLCHAFRGAEVVYHLAACISLARDDRDGVEAVNVNGTRNVIEACRRAGVRRLVYCSSIHALEQEPLDTPVDESRPLVSSRHYPPYDLTKAAAEGEVRRAVAQGLDAVIINPTAIIGPHDYGPSFLGEGLLAMAQGRFPVLVTGGFDWVDARDVVAGAMRAEARAPAGASYLLSGHWASLCDMAAMVTEIAGGRRRRLVCPLWLARLGAPVVEGASRLSGKRPLYTSVSLRALRSNRHISHEKAARELGYRPRPFRETLVDTMRWFAQNGRLPPLPPVSLKESA